MCHPSRLFAALVALTLVLAVPIGCSRQAEEPGTGAPPDKSMLKVRFGTLPTEDSLPLWVAEKEGLFEEAGLDVEVQTFQAAQERDAALTAQAIDAYMGDIIAAANLEAGGTPVEIATVMLGATPEEGRFGIATAPKFEDEGGPLKVGTSSATIQEYVLDRLMEREGRAYEKVEIKKVPVRFDALMQNQLPAAALPEPFLSLAEMQGAKLLVEDTTGANISQTVMVVSETFLGGDQGDEAIDRLLEVWDEAADRINEDPEAYRDLLVEKARLPEPVKTSYRINEYPASQLPTEQQVGDVLTWMREKGYLKADLAYADLVRE